MPLPVSWPRHDRYRGVRAIQIYMLRTLYFLMAAFVATEAWRVILTHQGRGITCAPSPVRVGDVPDPGPPRAPPSASDDSAHALHHRLQVALACRGRLPLWRAGTLRRPPRRGDDESVLMTPLLIAAVPWGYVLRHYVLPARARWRDADRRAVADSSADSPSSSSSG